VAAQQQKAAALFARLLRLLSPSGRYGCVSPQASQSIKLFAGQIQVHAADSQTRLLCVRSFYLRPLSCQCVVQRHQHQRVSGAHQSVPDQFNSSTNSTKS
jgi:hypothetical protein